MRAKLLTLILITAIFTISLVYSPPTDTQIKPASSPTTALISNAASGYGKTPLDFERNQGQTDPAVKFLARNQGHTLFLTSSEAVFRLENRPAPKQGRQVPGKVHEEPTPTSAVLRMRFDGADPQAQLAGLDSLPDTSNYLDLSDDSKHLTGVEHFRQVRYEQLYPGIDLVFYGNDRTLEYDFIVAPHVDPSAIALSFAGAEDIRIEADGALALRLGAETVKFGAPVLYQERTGKRIPVDGKFRLDGAQRVSFEVGEYDADRELVIDPTLVYASYLGGGGDDYGNGIAVDSAGNAYIAGTTSSTNFPTTAGVLVPNDPEPASWDCYITKINPTGTAKVYSTYIGGPGLQNGNAIAVDSGGRVTLVGFTNQFTADGDAFAVRLNATGTSANTANGGYVYIFGGLYENTADDVAVDASGNAYISGHTASVGGGANFPAGGGIYTAFNTGNYDAFLVRLDNAGNQTYGTYLHVPQSGDYDEFGYGVAVDTSGNVYVSGLVVSFCTGVCDNSANFVMKFNPAINTFAYNGTYGGNNADRLDDMAVDTAGNAYVVGTTKSTDYPTTPNPIQNSNGGGEDIVFTKFNPNGTVAYSTYLGTDGSQLGQAIAVDPSGNVYIGGVNYKFDINGDAVAVKLLKNGANYTLGYSYRFVGAGADAVNDIAADAAGNAYVAGATNSTNFPSTPGVFQPAKATSGAAVLDAFVAKISDTAGPVDHPVADFDGDGKSDIGVYRASNFGWYIIQSSNNQLLSAAFGAAGDQIVPGDYDGDGKADIAIFRPSSGIWYLLRSTAGFTGVQFGANGDTPAAADYDGDGKTDIAVFRPANGTWYILNSATNTVRSQQFGAGGDRPVIGDYDGDGKDDLAVFRPFNGGWYQLNSTTGFVGLQFGLNTDLPAQSDYDGDHKTDVAVFRRSNGVWYRINSSTNTLVSSQFGASGDQPAPGDYDGDGKSDLGVYRPSAGSWYLMRSTAGMLGLQFGASSDIAIEGAYLPPNPAGN